MQKTRRGVRRALHFKRGVRLGRLGLTHPPRGRSSLPAPTIIITTTGFIRPGHQVTTMQMARDDSDRKSNPRAPLTRVLRPHRRASRNDSPRREFRDQLIEPGLDLVVDTVAGSRPIALLAGELDR
jgi:hypothetical protein